MRDSVIKKFWKFRIYPENKSLYFLVWIFKRKKDMLSYVRSVGIKRKPKNTLRACVVSLAIRRVTGDRAMMHPLCGDIVFCQKDLGVSVTSHEIVHAALNWARRVRLNLPEEEEKFCEVVGELNRQFTKKCYDLNIYK